jgi:hypothetical protein
MRIKDYINEHRIDEATKRSGVARSQLMNDMRKIDDKLRVIEKEFEGYIKKYGDAVRRDKTMDFEPLQKASSVLSHLRDLYVKLSRVGR